MSESANKESPSDTVSGANNLLYFRAKGQPPNVAVTTTPLVSVVLHATNQNVDNKNQFDRSSDSVKKMQSTTL